MTFNISRRERDGVLILDVTGKFVEDNVHLFRDALHAESLTRVVVNLAGSVEIDDGGCSQLDQLANRCEDAGGKLVLVTGEDGDLDPQACLGDIECCAHEQDAINSFFPERVIPHYDILSFVQQQGFVRS